MNLMGKTVLITGGARRLGRAIALELAAHGANIALHFRSFPEEAFATLNQIEHCGVQTAAFQANLLQSEELADMIAQVYRTFGQVDVLINNAAVFDRKSFFELTEADWDHTLDTNLKIPFLCSRLVGEKMLGQGTGKIINLACVGGVRPWANFIPYSVSKAGLIMLTEALALALAPLIQVNAIAPGRIEFPDHAVPDVPSFPTGQPQDITRAVRYLIESDYVTGETLLVDGGRHLR